LCIESAITVVELTTVWREVTPFWPREVLPRRSTCLASTFRDLSSIAGWREPGVGFGVHDWGQLSLNGGYFPLRFSD
jgi:hypothetical protein